MRGLVVHRYRAHGQILEQAGEIELPPPLVLDEALVERRFVEMGVGVDQPGVTIMPEASIVSSTGSTSFRRGRRG